MGSRLAAAGRWMVGMLAFTAVVWRILTRDRTALFFLLVLPVAVIVIVGAAFGGAGNSITVALVRDGGGPVSEAVESALRDAPALKVRQIDDVDEARDSLRRGDVAAVVVLPASLDAPTRPGEPARAPATVDLLVDLTSDAGQTARTTVTGVIQQAASAYTAAVVAADLTGAPVEETSAAVSGTTPPVTVSVRTAGTDPDAAEPAANGYAWVVPNNLVLFVFINALASAALIVAIRRAGVLTRAAATRSGTTGVLVGLGVGWLLLALAQSLLIIVVGAVGFGIDWGDPLGAALLVIAFAAVGCGAGLLVGAVGRDPDRASSVTPFAGIILGALGGCMVPLELFPPAVEAVAHITPHYWAVTAWRELLVDGAGVTGILGSLAVLAAMAAALLAAASVVLRRQLTRG